MRFCQIVYFPHFKIGEKETILVPISDNESLIVPSSLEMVLPTHLSVPSASACLKEYLFSVYFFSFFDVKIHCIKLMLAVLQSCLYRKKLRYYIWIFWRYPHTFSPSAMVLPKPSAKYATPSFLFI